MQRGHSTDEPASGSAAASAVSAADQPHRQQQQQQPPSAQLTCENVTFNWNGWMEKPTSVIVPRLFSKLDKLRKIAITPFPSIGRELVVASALRNAAASGRARRKVERWVVAGDPLPDGEPSQAAEYDAAKLQRDRQGGSGDLDWLLAASLWARVDSPTVQRCVHAPEKLSVDDYFLLTPARRTLRQLLDPLRPLPDLDVLCVTRCIADAVASLWQLNIHVGYQLLTPDNIILVEDGPSAGHWQLANQLPTLCDADASAADGAASGAITKPSLLSPSHATFASRNLMRRAGGEPTALAAGWCTLLAVLRLAIGLTTQAYHLSDERAVQSDCDHWVLLTNLSEQLWGLRQTVDNLCRRSQNAPQPAILTLLQHCDLGEWQAAWENGTRMPLVDLLKLRDKAIQLEREFESPTIGHVRLFSTGVF